MEKDVFLKNHEFNNGKGSNPDHQLSFSDTCFANSWKKKDKTGNIVKSMKNWPKRDKNDILKIVPNAGHNANMDSPEYVNRLIVDYLTNIKL